MVQTVIMPKLGQTQDEPTLLKWHKQPGDAVAKGDILFEIETDKAVLEVESFFEGVLLKIIVPEGRAVPVTTPVAFIGAPGDPIPEITLPAAPAQPAPAQPAPALASAVPASPAQPVAQPTDQSAGPAAAALATSAPPEPAKQKKAFSPRARRLLKEYPINPDAITGSGPGGRVIEQDVRAYLEASAYQSLRITPAAKALALREGIDVLSLERAAGRLSLADIERALAEKPQPMSKIRRIIAQRLTQSFTSLPHFYVSVKVDMTDLIELRQQLKKAGQNYSLNDFIMKSAALALLKHPTVNSVSDGQNVRWHSRVHLGMAVASAAGLVVPVIRDAATISLAELHSCAAELISKARQGKLLPAEMTGSTFTISNMGMLGVDSFSAIINPGESAILAVASIQTTPQLRQAKIVARELMTMTLSADHRLVDGTLAARFINEIKKQLEDVALWKNMISS